MLANMMGVPSGGSAIERILYGDKVAAIGLALHGGHEDSKKPWRVVRLEACGDYYIFYELSWSQIDSQGLSSDTPSDPFWKTRARTEGRRTRRKKR